MDRMMLIYAMDISILKFLGDEIGFFILNLFVIFDLNK